MGKNVLPNAKHFHWSCHATWLPCITSIRNLFLPGVSIVFLPHPLLHMTSFFFVLTHSHGHYCSAELGTSSKKKCGHLRMSHRLPKLSFLFPEVEDFLRNSLFPREVIYTLSYCFSDKNICAKITIQITEVTSLSINLKCRETEHLFSST